MPTLYTEKGVVEAKGLDNPHGTSTNVSTVSDDDELHSISQESEQPPTGHEKDIEDPIVSNPTPDDDEPPRVVPRSKRRGLFGQLTLLDEVENPKAYPRNKKWFITFVVAVAGSVAPMGSSIFFPALAQVSDDLDTTTTIANLTIALYMLSLSIFPLWWSSFSERLGRRTIYLVSFILFIVFNVLCAVSSSIAMLIVMRLLSGGASASVQAVGAGTIADLWHTRERGHAMGIFYLGPLCGPLIAPIVGGALAQRWQWRSTLWFLSAYGAVVVVLIFFGLPETLTITKPLVLDRVNEPEGPIGRRLSRVSSRQVLSTTTRWLKLLKLVFLDPLKIILNLRHLPVLLTVYYGSITFGSLYVLNVSIERTFSEPPYNFSTVIVGLLYIPTSVGYVVSSIFGGRWMDSIMEREAKRANRYSPTTGKLIYLPEDRMRENAWLSAMLYPAALIWYGWTSDKGVHWLAPMVANFFFGVGSMLIFSTVTTMLTEFMPRKSSEGVALNNFCRNIFSCVGSFVTAPIIDGIGNGWLFTILGVVAFVSSGVILVMRVWGPKWRGSMDGLQ